MLRKVLEIKKLGNLMHTILITLNKLHFPTHPFTSPHLTVRLRASKKNGGVINLYSRRAINEKPAAAQVGRSKSKTRTALKRAVPSLRPSLRRFQRTSRQRASTHTHTHTYTHPHKRAYITGTMRRFVGARSS